MQKRIELDDGNILIILKTPGYCCDTISINKGYMQDGELQKNISLTIWDDMAFHAHSEIDENDYIEFEFDIQDPLYFCINRLLANDNEFIIDDDDTSKTLEKYMIIKREDKLFKIIFINKNPESKRSFERYGAFIKNIGPDARSKIDEYSTKIRIIKFFRDMEKMLLEEYHQMTIDEYIELITQEEGPVLKKINNN